MDALLDAYPASFGQLMDAAVHRHTPSSSSSSAEDGPTAASGVAGDQGDTAQDNLSKLKALLERQQQQEQEKQRAAGDAGSASLAAAAARLEGLLAAPAAPGADEVQQPPEQQQQQQQQEDSSAPVGEQVSKQQQQEQQQQVEQLLQQQQQLQQLQAEAAALEDDTPMPKPQVVLVGATVSNDDITLALNRGWVEEPVLVRVGTAGNVPAGLKHRAVVVAGPEKRLGGLVSSLRKDLTDALADADAAAAAGRGGELQQSQQQQHAAPVRVIVFAASEVEARGAAEPLRAALWGDHMLSVLLPSTGAEPIKALHAFRDRVASLLLATPSAARGLDLPAVSHVYSLGLPPDATDYVHRAGRAGRIGSTEGGEVCTVVTREELPELQRMVEQELGLELEVVELDRQGLGLLGSEYDAARQGLLLGGDDEEEKQQAAEAGMGDKQLENARKGLEDLFNLL
jgi:Lhr-like helicase